MWKCPKCGRAFRNTNQSHYCGNAPATVDEYILAQDEAIREQLQSVRMAKLKAQLYAGEVSGTMIHILHYGNRDGNNPIPAF